MSFQYEEIINVPGIVELQEQKAMGVDELVKLCTHTEKSCPAFKRFDFLQIMDGTDNFSTRKIVGRGGFGTVYKVIINRNIMRCTMKNECLINCSMCSLAAPATS